MSSMIATNDSDAVVTDALTLLRHDHRLIAALFTEFELAGAQQLDPLARRICKMLRVHTQIEEELFYPVARSVVSATRLVDDSEAQHREIQEGIVRAESLSSDHPDFLSTMTQLGIRIRGHMEAEETMLFPYITAGKVNLVGLGLVLVERRDTLMRMLGLTDDDEIPALRQLTEGEAVASRRPLPLVSDGEGRADLRGRVRQDARRHRAR
jgi:precorrin-2 methylase